MSYKYKVLETCHAGGRMCRKGAVIEFKDKVNNKYLEQVNDNDIIILKKEGQPLSSLNKKPRITTGMAANIKDE